MNLLTGHFWQEISPEYEEENSIISYEEEPEEVNNIRKDFIGPIYDKEPEYEEEPEYREEPVYEREPGYEEEPLYLYQTDPYHEFREEPKIFKESSFGPNYEPEYESEYENPFLHDFEEVSEKFFYESEPTEFPKYVQEPIENEYRPEYEAYEYEESELNERLTYW